MDEERLTDSDDDKSLIIKSEQKSNCDGADTRSNVLSDWNQHQPGTSHATEPDDGANSTESRLGLPQALDEERSSSKDKTCKSKMWPFKHRPCINTSEKRSLSSSQENLLSDDRPRKNVKFCHKIIKCFFPSCESNKKERERLSCPPGDRGDNDDVSSYSDSDGSKPLTSLDTSRTCESISATTCTKNKHTGSYSQVELKDGTHHRCGCFNDDIIEDVLPLRHFNVLPPQIITHIFSFLTVQELLCTAALVCKHWERVSQASCLWLDIKLRNHTSVTDDVLISLCSRHCSVGFLDLSDCLRITNNGLSRALPHCKVLRELFLIRCSQLTDGAFLSIATHCFNLIHLNLSNCTGLTDQALKSIAEQCPRLQKLRLKQCARISDSSLQVVALRCQRLKVLTFADNDKITDTTLEALASHNHHLEILCLQKCGVRPPGIMQITKLNHLKKLDLSNLSTLTPEAVKLVAEHCTLLDTLNLSLSKDVSDASVSCVAMSCKKLTTLFLISCAITDRALFSIGENSVLLEHLDISWCVDITAHGAVFVSEHCPRLNYLGLIRCKHVSDTVVERLVTNHPGIHYSTFLLDSRRLIDKAKEQGFF